jgi:hypothetical protein
MKNKRKSDNDFSTMTLQEAILWAEQNTAMADVCKRLRSRAVAKLLLNHCKELEIQLQKAKALQFHAERIANRYQPD